MPSRLIARPQLYDRPLHSCRGGTLGTMCGAVIQNGGFESVSLNTTPAGDRVTFFLNTSCNVPLAEGVDQNPRGSRRRGFQVDGHDHTVVGSDRERQKSFMKKSRGCNAVFVEVNERQRRMTPTWDFIRYRQRFLGPRRMGSTACGSGTDN
jgi:hypothetical protein